jgi:hypothetical protein
MQSHAKIEASDHSLSGVFRQAIAAFASLAAGQTFEELNEIGLFLGGENEGLRVLGATGAFVGCKLSPDAGPWPGMDSVPVNANSKGVAVAKIACNSGSVKTPRLAVGSPSTRCSFG